MKNKIIAIFAVCLILLNCTTAFANTFAGDDTVNEIKDAEENIIQFVNDIVLTEDFKQCSVDDIDYSKIYKVYLGMSKVFENSEMNNEIMQNCLKNENYAYYVPFYDNGKTSLATVVKNQELTDDVKAIFPDEEIQKYEASIGKWDTSSVGIIEEIRDYKGDLEKILKDNNIENANVYLLGAISSNIRLAAVICTDNPNDTKIKIIEQFESENEDVGSKLDKNVLYSYDEIKAVVDADKEAQEDFPDDAVGGVGISAQTSTPTTNNSKIIIISAVAGVAVLAIAAAAICIAKKKKTEKVTKE